MQRGSDRLSVHRDDEMKHELRDLLRSGHPTRTEEWHDPEPGADDDPEVASGPVTPYRSPARREALPVEELRFELGRILGRTSFPAHPRELADVLRAKHAPDVLIEPVERLPGKTRYATAHELAEAIVGAGAVARTEAIVRAEERGGRTR